MSMQYKISDAIEAITLYLKAKIVPFLKGPPAIGKSGIVRQIAKNNGLKVIDLRLSQCDPTDLLGFPSIQGKRAGYAPMETFPIQGDEIPEGYNGWLLFLDEFSSAPPAVQAAAYKLVLDRMVGVHHLHEKVFIVCAGNREQDNAIVQPMSTALQSRLGHMELVVDPKEWVTWAQNNDVNHKITDYIQFKPGALYTFKPDHTDDTYGSPRTWEFASNVMEHVGEDSPLLLAMLSGVLSEGVAREFRVFCKIYADLPKPAAIMANPESVKIPNEPSVLYALCGTVSHNATAENLGALMKFVHRLPKEFQVVALRDTIRRNVMLASHPEIRKWISTSAADLFA